MRKYLQQLIQGHSLTRSEASAATLLMLSENAFPEQTAALLCLLRAKGETTDEILGVIDVLLPKMTPVITQKPSLDIVGTGGDGLATVNISSGAAILAASCGVTVAKHGNRAVSSLCGSADVLQALGVNIEMSAAQVASCLSAINIGFCFAPRFHPALAQLREIRRHLAVATLFNLVGPLLNPCRPAHYVLGVFSESLLKLFADLLSALELGKSVVVYAEGMDEMSCCGITQVIEIDQGRQRSYSINPQELGLGLYPPNALQGGDPKCNAGLLTEAFSGKTGAIADTLILNAAMAIYIYGITHNLLDAVQIARQQIANGSALRLLESWRNFEYA